MSESKGVKIFINGVEVGDISPLSLTVDEVTEYTSPGFEDKFPKEKQNEIAKDLLTQDQEDFPV